MKKSRVLHWSQADLDRHKAKGGKVHDSAPAKQAKTATKMSSLEIEYQRRLEVLVKTGIVSGFDFEPVKLIIGYACTYTPDFRVVNNDGSVIFIETKGREYDDAIVKFKVAAWQNRQYRFVMIKKISGQLVVTRDYNKEAAGFPAELAGRKGSVK